MIRGKQCRKIRVVMQAAVTSATGSEKKAASAVKTAGRRSRQLKKISLRNAEQNSASFT